MDATEYRNLLGLIWIILLFVLMPLSFRRQTKRPEIKALMESGQLISLNLLTLVPASFRKRDDPLRRSHIRIALIGFAHFFGRLFEGLFGLVAIISVLRLLA